MQSMINVRGCLVRVKNDTMHIILVPTVIATPIFYVVFLY